MSARRAFLRGLSTVLDVYGVADYHVGVGGIHRDPLAALAQPRHRQRAIGFDADSRALAGDWRAIGDDLRAVLGKVKTSASG